MRIPALEQQGDWEIIGAYSGEIAAIVGGYISPILTYSSISNSREHLLMLGASYSPVQHLAITGSVQGNRYGSSLFNDGTFSTNRGLVGELGIGYYTPFGGDSKTFSNWQAGLYLQYARSALKNTFEGFDNFSRFHAHRLTLTAGIRADIGRHNYSLGVRTGQLSYRKAVFFGDVPQSDKDNALDFISQSPLWIIEPGFEYSFNARNVRFFSNVTATFPFFDESYFEQPYKAWLALFGVSIPLSTEK